MRMLLGIFSTLLWIGIFGWTISAEKIDLHRPNWFESALDQNTDSGSGALLERIREAEDYQEGGKNIITDVLIAYFLSQLKKASDFPTAFTTANISEQCKQDSLNYYNAHRAFQIWALQMYESSGKNPEGLFGSRNVQAFGLFDECLAVKPQPFNDTSAGPSGNWTEVNFSGQYCSVFFDTVVLFPNETNLIEEEELLSDDYPSQRDFWVYWAQVIQVLANGPTVLQPREKDTDTPSSTLPRVDLCIPSSCSHEDLRIAVGSFVGNRAFSSFNDSDDGQQYFVAVSTQTGDGYCFTQKEIETTPSFDGPDIAVIVVLSLLGFFALLATMHEGWRDYCDRPIDLKVEGLPIRFLNCFSVLNNGKKILGTKINSSDNLGCLNGIRVLSTTWVVMGHTYFKAIDHPMYNAVFLYEEAKQWQFHGVVTMATVSVDSFFLISGLLVAYLLLRELDRSKGRFNVILFYVHRYLRLTPVYAIILGFIATLMVYTTTGPNWENIVKIKTACRYNWWNNFLYVNNYVYTYPIKCMGQTWYLACDMQMFILSPLFIYPLWRWWKIGVSWTIFSILALQAGLVTIYIIWNVPATLFVTRRGNSDRDFFQDYYIQMWTRFPPYLLGILLGWFLYYTKGKTIKMNKLVVVGGWSIATAMALAILYGLTPYLDPTIVPTIDDGIRVSFGVIYRLAWAVAVAWVIFACTNGYGGFVNRLLSWKVFIPLGRLTYVVYLIHLDYIMVYWSHARKPYYYTVLDHIQHYFGVLFMVFLLAFFISVTVEAPFLNLEKLLFSAAQQKPIQKVENGNHNKDNFKIPRLNPTPNDTN